MTKQITTLQAMQHWIVVATIDVLSEMNQRLQDENEELKAALAQPPQRPWVGLTDEERDECDWGQGGCDYARIIEAKLKEKNT